MITMFRTGKKERCEICNKYKRMNFFHNLYKEKGVYRLKNEISLCNKCLHNNFRKSMFENQLVLINSFENYYKLIKLIKNKKGVDKTD